MSGNSTRKIKFRLWDGERMFSGENLHTLTHMPQAHTVTFLQYTGLLDSEGKEIYEGDLIHVVMPEAFIGARVSDLVRPVRYGHGSFYVDGIDDLSMFNAHRDRLEVFEVVGSIYENPELIQ